MSPDLARLPPPVTSAPTWLSKSSSTRVKSPWLVGRWFDLIFLANLGWIALFAIGWSFGIEGHDRIHFWQVYFVTTPHRWITLALVFLDREQFIQRRSLFSGLAIGIAMLCLTVHFSSGGLVCLLAIDYVWNAWHFSAQHHGIYRIYDRNSGDPSLGSAAMLEKWALRGFLLYVIFRVAGAAGSPSSELWFIPCDYIALLLPCVLIGREIHKRGVRPGGRSYYLLSVLSLYSALLWSVHTRQFEIVLLLTTLSALFHAIEYLAIVGWNVQGRAAARGQRMGILGWLAPRWGIALTLYILILGSAGWMIEQGWMQTWLLVNVIVAFLHYAFDGLIWRRRGSPSTPSLPANAT